MHHDSRTRISDLERQRAELEAEVASLRRHLEEDRKLLDAIPVPLAVHHDGRFAFINAAGVALLRAGSAEGIVGRTIFDLMPKADKAATFERIKAAHETGRPPPPIRTQFVGGDGNLFDVEISTYPVVFEGRRGMLTIVRDLTELRRVEEEKEKLSRQMLYVQKLESLGVLAGGIAHDFNNLLMAILGNIDLALSSLPQTSQVRGNLLAAETASRRAADLARQMLAYSGRGKFLVEPLNLNDIVGEMAHMLEVSVPKKARLLFDLSSELEEVEGDAAQLTQVLMNVVLNAAEAIGDAEGVISVATRMENCSQERLKDTWIDDGLPGGSYVLLEVRDSGCGMDEETRRRVFDPFFTTKFTGRGLGLAAVLGIVRGHHGAIEVHSELGRGTLFVVYLPVSRRPLVQTPAPQPLHARSSGHGAVLLADDEEVLRQVGSQMLAKLGYRPIVVADGVEAVAAIRDLVAGGGQDTLLCAILDLKMPRMDGVEACREIRKLCPRLPIFLSSGYTEQDATERFRDGGLAGFIQKPYMMKTLSEALEAIDR